MIFCPDERQFDRIKKCLIDIFKIDIFRQQRRKIKMSGLDLSKVNNKKGIFLC